MGDIAARLDRKDEIFRNGIRPTAQIFFRGQFVEGIIDLDGTETSGVIIQEVSLQTIAWVKRTFPVRVLPAGCANMTRYFFSLLYFN